MLSGDGLALYATRVPSAPEVTAETLATMEAGLAASAGLLPALDRLLMLSATPAPPARQLSVPPQLRRRSAAVSKPAK